MADGRDSDPELCQRYSLARTLPGAFLMPQEGLDAFAASAGPEIAIGSATIRPRNAARSAPGTTYTRLHLSRSKRRPARSLLGWQEPLGIALAYRRRKPGPGCTLSPRLTNTAIEVRSPLGAPQRAFHASGPGAHTPGDRQISHRPFGRDAADLFFSVLDTRYERRRTALPIKPPVAP